MKLVVHTKCGVEMDLVGTIPADDKFVERGVFHCHGCDEYFVHTRFSITKLYYRFEMNDMEREKEAPKSECAGEHIDLTIRPVNHSELRDMVSTFPTFKFGK